MGFMENFGGMMKGMMGGGMGGAMGGNPMMKFAKSAVTNLGDPGMHLQLGRAAVHDLIAKKWKGKEEAATNQLRAEANKLSTLTAEAERMKNAFMSGSVFSTLVDQIEQSKQGTIRQLNRSGGGKQAIIAGILGASRQSQADQGKIISEAMTTVLPNLLQQQIQAGQNEAKAKGDVLQYQIASAAARRAQHESAKSENANAFMSQVGAGLTQIHKDMTSGNSNGQNSSGGSAPVSTGGSNVGGGIDDIDLQKGISTLLGGKKSSGGGLGL